MWKSNYLALWTDQFEWRALDLPSFCYWNITCRHKSRGQRLHKVGMFAKIHMAKKYCFFIFFLYIRVSWRRQDADVLIIKCLILLELISACCIAVERLFENLICQQLLADVLQHCRQPRITFKAAVCSGKDERRQRKMGDWALINTSP